MLAREQDSLSEVPCHLMVIILSSSRVKTEFGGVVVRGTQKLKQMLIFLHLHGVC